MSKIFYHGSNKLFDKFETKYSKHGGEIFVSPCKCRTNDFISNKLLMEVTGLKQFSNKNLSNPTKLN
jgi:hypothetical protein